VNITYLNKVCTKLDGIADTYNDQRSIESEKATATKLWDLPISLEWIHGLKALLTEKYCNQDLLFTNAIKSVSLSKLLVIFIYLIIIVQATNGFFSRLRLSFFPFALHYSKTSLINVLYLYLLQIHKSIKLYCFIVKFTETSDLPLLMTYTSTIF
jgi:hypothetical protein